MLENTLEGNLSKTLSSVDIVELDITLKSPIPESDMKPYVLKVISGADIDESPSELKCILDNPTLRVDADSLEMYKTSKADAMMFFLNTDRVTLVKSNCDVLIDVIESLLLLITLISCLIHSRFSDNS